jgi:hypothetical protein
MSDTESYRILRLFPVRFSGMERRPFLAASIGLILPTGAGCLSREQTPEGMEVDTHHWVADILEEGIWYRRQELNESVEQYHELIEDEIAAKNRIDGDEEVMEFVEKTDFTDSYLIIVQNIMQSARWLELHRIERTEQGLDIAIKTASPDEPYGDDATAHSLAIRLTDEQAGVPDDLHVTVDGTSTDG